MNADQSAISNAESELNLEKLSGIGLSIVWDILIATCKEIVPYYGGAAVTGAVIGGAASSLAFGVGGAGREVRAK